MRIAAEAALFSAQRMAEGQLFAKQKEAEGQLALYTAHAEGLQSLFKSLGNDPSLLAQYVSLLTLYTFWGYFSFFLLL